MCSSDLDEEFMTKLRGVFPRTESQIVTFPNPLQDRESQSTVYLAQIAS